jgi:hypothetical protein
MSKRFGEFLKEFLGKIFGNFIVANTTVYYTTGIISIVYGCYTGNNTVMTVTGRNF